MTTIVTPIPIDALPTAPTPADTPQDFDSKAFALLAAMVAMVAQINDTGSKTNQNAIAANERAVSADSSAIAAGGSANAAALDAARLAALDAQWLGAFAADPATGREGAPLVAGNAYVNTVTGVVRACMFLGTHYEVTIGCGEEDWIAYSAEYMESGEEIGLMVSADKIAVSANEAN